MRMGKELNARNETRGTPNRCGEADANFLYRYLTPRRSREPMGHSTRVIARKIRYVEAREALDGWRRRLTLRRPGREDG
jgi:hypothetical protein